MSHVASVSDDEFEERVLKSGHPVVVGFWAEWCRSCHLMFDPALEGVAKAYVDRVTVLRMNVEESPRALATYSVTSIPTIRVFSHGEVVGSIHGIKTPAGLAQEVDRLINP